MTSLTLEGVATFLTLLALVGGAYEGTPSYYWSRSKVGTAHVSRRAHIGPLPHVNDFMTEWSPWGAWARCSRSCGGGVRSRVRTCVAKFPRVMPGSGIRTSHDHCSGDSKQYDVCGTRPCVTEEVAGLSFRAAQCRRYNNRRVFGRLVNNWVPYVQEGMNPCSLVCEGEGQGIVYTFGKVTDGTHCKIRDKGRDGLCVNGRCLPLSCDGRLGGTAREDMCRVCAGRNDTCIHHVGVFHTDLPYPDLAQPPPPPLPPPLPPTQGNMVHRPPPLPPPPSPPPPVPRQRRRLGYYEVTRLPPGATNIRVRDKSPNFLALKSGGKFLLNGDWLIDWPGEVEAGGSSFTYTRDEDDSETLTALGPTTEALTLMVLLREHNPGIFYEYWIPTTTTTTTITATTTTTTTSTTTATTTTMAPRPESLMLLPATTTATTTTANTTRHHHHHHYHHHHDHHQHKPQNSLIKSGRERRLNGTREGGGGGGGGEEEWRSPNALNLYEWKKGGGGGRGRGRGGWDAKRKSSLLNRQENESHKLHRKSKGRGGGGGEGGGRLEEEEEEEEGRGLKQQIMSRKDDKYERGRGEEKKNKKKRRKDKKKKKRKKKKRKEEEEEEEDEEEEGKCLPCKKGRKKTREIFCVSDFVSRVEVLGEEVVSGQRRYEVLMHQSYKNTVPLLHKEFLWVPESCRCPRLRRGLSYIVMGATESLGSRELRLVLGRDSIVRRFKPKYLARIMRVRHNEMRSCRPWRRDLRLQGFSQASSASSSASSGVVGPDSSSSSGGSSGGGSEGLSDVPVNSTVLVKS